MPVRYYIHLSLLNLCFPLFGIENVLGKCLWRRQNVSFGGGGNMYTPKN